MMEDMVEHKVLQVGACDTVRMRIEPFHRHPPRRAIFPATEMQRPRTIHTLADQFLGLTT